MVNIIKQIFKWSIIADANNIKKSTIDSADKNICPIRLEKSQKGYEKSWN